MLTDRLLMKTLNCLLHFLCLLLLIRMITYLFFSILLLFNMLYFGVDMRNMCSEIFFNQLPYIFDWPDMMRLVCIVLTLNYNW